MNKKYSRMLEELGMIMAQDIIDTWKMKADTCRKKDRCSKPLCFVETLSSEQQMLLATTAVATVFSYVAEMSSYARDILNSQE